MKFCKQCGKQMEDDEEQPCGDCRLRSSDELEEIKNG